MGYSVHINICILCVQNCFVACKAAVFTYIVITTGREGRTPDVVWGAGPNGNKPPEETVVCSIILYSETAGSFQNCGHSVGVHALSL